MNQEGFDVPVLVAGGGPVGLMTALELTRRGVRALVIERNPETTQHPKMDVTNGRSMEHFRRLGIAERIRDHAVPRENPMDVTWVTRLGEYEVARFPYPNVHEARDRIRARNDGSQPLEPYMRMSQVILEPLLRDILLESPLVDLRFDTALEGFVQDADGVTATIRDAEGVQTIRCAYLAGCDGGNSVVRRTLGARWEGTFNAVRFYMIHFRTPARAQMRRFGIAWHFRSPVGGMMIAQDDDQIYTLHRQLPADVDEATIDPVALARESLGMDIPIEIIRANGWHAHLVVAERYGSGRVWMAGDSVHQFIPTGGYGMNTGMCDAVDLGWKLAAMLAGWGGPRLLDSVEAERKPVAIENRDSAGLNMSVRTQIAAAYDPRMHDDTPEGAAARQVYGRLVFDLGNAASESLGVEIGYRYRHSPIICHEGDEPEWRRLDYIPSTWPGVRAPHVFLADGTAIFDRFGAGFTLLRFVDTDVSQLIDAADAAGVPLSVVDIRDHVARKVYERDLVLIRPDQHVAWRGNADPADAVAIIDRLRGA